MKILKLIPLKFKIIIVLCYVFPLLIDTPNGNVEAIWNLLVIPTIAFAYYYGLPGGIISAIANISVYGLSEWLQYTNTAQYNNSNIHVFAVLSIMMFAAGTGTGLIAGKMKRLIKSLESQKAELDQINKELHFYWDEAQEILNNIGASIWSYDLLNNKFLISSKPTKLFGCSLSELISDQKRFEQIFKVNGKTLVETFKENLSNTNVSQNEHEISNENGEVRWLRNYLYPVLNEEGQPVKVNGVFLDITKQKNIESQLQSIIEFLPDATVVVDKDLKVIAWNKPMEELTGISKEKMLGKGDHAFTVPFYGEARPNLIDLVFDYNQEIAQNYKNLKNKGDILCGESFVPCVNEGKGAFVWATASIILDEKGNVAGAIECIRDITDMRILENELRESEERYRSLVELCPLPVVVHKQGNIVYTNQAALSFFYKLGLGDITRNSSLFELFELNDPVTVKVSLEQARQAAPQFTEQKVKVKNDQTIDVLLATVEIPYEDESAIMTVFQDITEQKMAEEAIKNYNQVLSREMELAAKVQLNMLPANLPKIDGMNFGWEFKPSTFISGDMFNILILSENLIGFYILDVMGHGLAAALQAVSINFTLKPSHSKSVIMADDLLKPAQTLELLNNAYIHRSVSGKFFTIFYGVINTQTWELTYARAGHPAPLVITSEGRIHELHEGGLPIGLFRDTVYENYHCQLKPGDQLVLYTDGIENHYNGSPLKVKLEELLAKGNKLGIEKLLKTIMDRTFQGKMYNEEDDIALLGIEIEEMS